MKITAVALPALLLTFHPANAQQPPSTARATTPIAGIDDEAVARGARASKLIGSKVYQGDTSIGQIEDVLVALDGGKIQAIIISVGGFLSVGEKLVAIPVNQIKVGSEAKFTTELTKEQLTAAPVFVYGKAN